MILCIKQKKMGKQKTIYLHDDTNKLLEEAIINGYLEMGKVSEICNNAIKDAINMKKPLSVQSMTMEQVSNELNLLRLREMELNSTLKGIEQNKEEKKKVEMTEEQKVKSVFDRKKKNINDIFMAELGRMATDEEVTNAIISGNVYLFIEQIKKNCSWTGIEQRKKILPINFQDRRKQ